MSQEEFAGIVEKAVEHAKTVKKELNLDSIQASLVFSHLLDSLVAISRASKADQV